MLFANVCAGFFSSWYGVRGERKFLGFLVSPWCLVHIRVYQLCQSSPLCVQGLGLKDVPPAGHALRAEFGGGIIFVTLGEFAAQHKKTANTNFDRVCGFCISKLYFQALVGRPSLHSYDASMVYWVQGASRRNCRQKQGRTSFSPNRFFCLVGIQG